MSGFAEVTPDASRWVREEWPAVAHDPQPQRRRDGLSRWFASCPCGWTATAGSREDAAVRAAEHAVVIAAVRALAELYEGCYDNDRMEYGPTYPCPRCQLRESLTVLAGVPGGRYAAEDHG